MNEFGNQQGNRAKKIENVSSVERVTVLGFQALAVDAFSAAFRPFRVLDSRIGGNVRKSQTGSIDATPQLLTSVHGLSFEPSLYDDLRTINARAIFEAQQAAEEVFEGQLDNLIYINPDTSSYQFERGRIGLTVEMPIAKKSLYVYQKIIRAINKVDPTSQPENENTPPSMTVGYRIPSGRLRQQAESDFKHEVSRYKNTPQAIAVKRPKLTTYDKLRRAQSSTPQ